MYLDRIVPDFTINDGGRVTLNMKLKNFPNGEIREKGPFVVTPTTQLYEHVLVVVKLLFVSRHLRVELTGD